MKVLTFKINYSGKRWADYLKEMFGEEIAEKCMVESVTTKDLQYAVVNILNFDGNSNILQTVQADKNVQTAYIVKSNAIKKVLV